MGEELQNKEKLYYPHLWQKRYPPESALATSIAFANRQSEIVKQIMKCEFDVPYGLLPREKYTIYGIDLPDDSPILIFVHGGYWQVKELTSNNQGLVAKTLHRRKIKVISVDYEQCPDTTVRAIMCEIEVAVKRCLAYALRNKSKGVYLMGHSAGAHLIASLFSTFTSSLSSEEQSIIKAAFLLCGLYDLTPLVDIPINDALKLTLDEAKSVSPQFMDISSPSHIKFFVVAAEYDSPAFVEQSRVFYEKLKQQGVNADFKLLNDKDHFSAFEDLSESSFECTQLIIKTVKSG